MNQKLLIVWALSATALALVFLGYAIGKTTEADKRLSASAAYGSHLADTSGGEPQVELVDPYVVPAVLDGMPSEWRSPFDGKNFHGYAILFDPMRREVIVEKCRHPGYFDERKGVAVDGGWDFCNNVLWGSLVRIDEFSATAVNRAGQELELELTLDGEGDERRLSLSFPGHAMVLQAGSKNDLLQALEFAPQMQKQKDRLMKTIVAQEQAQRRVAEESGDGRQVAVPTYTVPAGEDRQDETDTEK